MKRFILVALVCLMIASLCACSSTPATQEPVKAPEEKAETEATPEPTEAPTPEPTAEPTPEPTPEPIKIGTRKNPMTLNTPVLFDGMDTIFDTYKVELSLVEVIRGEKALEMAKEGNRFNSEPDEGKEYLFAKFKIRALESEGDEVIDINGACFDLISEKGVAYDDFVAVSGVEPSLTEMYAGAEQEAYAFFYVNKDDANPTIVFLERNDSGIWFTTDPNATMQEGSAVYTPVESLGVSGADVSAEVGSRKNPVKLNNSIEFNGMDTIFDTYKVELTLLEVIRGEEAWNMAKEGNKYNSEPDEGKEYLFARFKINAIESKDDEKIDINSVCFDLISQDGKKYDDFVSVSGLEPELTEMYAGAEQEGYAYFMVNIDDTNPSIIFLDRNDGGIWFSTVE